MYRITDACTTCGYCLDTCPIGAIDAAEPIFVIDESLCCDFEECVAACPEDAIVYVEGT